MHGDEARYNKLRGATRFLGASTLLVPPMTLVRTHPESELSSVGPGGGGGGDNDSSKGDTTTGTSAATTGKEEQFWDFELEYTPLRIGFVPVGGLRVLLLEDLVQGTEEAYPERRSSNAPVVLKEWDVIGEIWVKS
jgi:trafficking protein particle complex subunit 13